MLWTAEAIEVLKSLALAGRSASVIAAALGAPSRNAVIGKANRIGIKLSGGPGGATPRGLQPVPHRVQSAAVALPDRRIAKQSFAPARSLAPKRKAAWPFAEAEVGQMQRVGFGDIREFACRWPLGDPMSGDFTYCGLEAAKGHAYCPGHCRLAYQPPKARAWREPRTSHTTNPWRPR